MPAQCPVRLAGTASGWDLVPWLLSSQELREFRLKYTKFVASWVTQDPEFETSSYLVIPSGSTKCFETLNFGFNVVSLEIKMHTFFCGLLIVVFWGSIRISESGR